MNIQVGDLLFFKKQDIEIITHDLYQVINVYKNGSVDALNLRVDRIYYLVKEQYVKAY